MTTSAAFTRHDITTADGTTLGVHAIDGTGSLIVALHGFTGSAENMLPLLNAVRDGRPAMAIDLIGHGSSDAPDHLEAYSMASVVDQVHSVIGPRERDTVHLIGYSMGGRIALSLVARAPWYFASITTVSATAGIDDPVERAKRHEADLELAERIETVGVDVFVEEWLTKPIFESYVASLDEHQRSATVALRNRSQALGLANSLRGTGTGAMPPVWTRLGALRSPLLAVAGALDDRYVDIANTLAKQVKDGQVSVIEDAGHVVHDENLDGITHVVSNFLQSCDFPAHERGPE